MVWCGVVWCGVVWCGVVWCGVVWCGVVWWQELRAWLDLVKTGRIICLKVILTGLEKCQGGGETDRPSETHTQLSVVSRVRQRSRAEKEYLDSSMWGPDLLSWNPVHKLASCYIFVVVNPDWFRLSLDRCNRLNNFCICFIPDTCVRRGLSWLPCGECFPEMLCNIRLRCGA